MDNATFKTANRSAAAFDNANALTYSEINILLKKYVENKRLLDSNFQPNPMMKLAQEYAERFATTTNSDVAQQIRKCVMLLVG